MATLPYDPRSRPVPPTFSHSLYIPKHVLWEELFTKHQQRGTKIRVVVKYTKTSYPKSEDEEEITVTLPMMRRYNNSGRNYLSTGQHLPLPVALLQQA